VMTQQEVAGQITDGRRLGARVALDRDQELVLNVGQAGRPSLTFAPPLEPAQATAEGQQMLEILAVRLMHAVTSRNASSHDMLGAAAC
jgi:hypothetical protein